VSPDALKFKITSSFEHGTSILYPHLEFNPADFKVTMYVSIDDLGLTAEEKLIFIEMIGKRYNQGKKEVRLTTERFPNRIENKRYLVVLLENLIAETKLLRLQFHK
jgi:predicted nucleotide-binding protein (sugar kinase/HSP70/actin superfamily)